MYIIASIASIASIAWSLLSYVAGVGLGLWIGIRYGTRVTASLFDDWPEQLQAAIDNNEEMGRLRNEIACLRRTLVPTPPDSPSPLVSDATMFDEVRNPIR